jgi:hypothetical protein
LLITIVVITIIGFRSFDSDSSQNFSSALSSSSIQSSITTSSKSILVSSKAQFSKVVDVQNPININSIAVEQLDSKNPPQYIQDYLGCTDKTSSRFVTENNSIFFKCRPSLEYLGCKNTAYYFGKNNTDAFYQRFGKGKDGWYCDIPGMDIERGCDFYIENELTFPRNPLTPTILVSIKSKVKEALPADNNCILNVQKDFNQDQKRYLDEVFPKIGFKIYNSGD